MASTSLTSAKSLSSPKGTAASTALEEHVEDVLGVDVSVSPPHAAKSSSREPSSEACESVNMYVCVYKRVDISILIMGDASIIME